MNTRTDTSESSMSDETNKSHASEFAPVRAVATISREFDLLEIAPDLLSVTLSPLDAYTARFAATQSRNGSTGALICRNGMEQPFTALVTPPAMPVHHP